MPMGLLREWMHRLIGALRRGGAMRICRRSCGSTWSSPPRMRSAAASRRAPRVCTPAASAQAMDALRDQRGWPWLHSVSSDFVFAWRQLKKHRTASLAAILSLGLAVGATTAAFRLLDAVLLRTLPVAEPDRLFVLGWNSMTSQGEPDYRDDFDYPTFRRYQRRHRTQRRRDGRRHERAATAAVRERRARAGQYGSSTPATSFRHSGFSLRWGACSHRVTM